MEYISVNQENLMKIVEVMYATGGYDRITKAGIEIPDALKIEGSYAER